MADTRSPRPSPAGVLRPLRSEDDFDLEVIGRIPDALAGAYYRNGANPQFDPEGPYFPFLGDGMIHGFFLEPDKSGGRAFGAIGRPASNQEDASRARYRNRWVRTPKWHAEHHAGRLLWRGFGTPSDPSAPAIHPVAANIHVVHHAGKLLALDEHGEPFELDPQGLEHGAFLNTGGKRTAHPKLDPQTGEMLWFAYFAGPEPLSNAIDYGITNKAGAVTRRDRFAAPYASVIHDFMVTRNYVLFPVMPLTGDRARASKGMPPLAWEAARGGFIGVMKRSASVDSIRWFEIEPRFFLHSMNAWEEGETTIHCEVTEFPRPPFFPNADGSPAPQVQGRLTRWTIDLAANTNQARRHQIDDLDSEMPRVDDRFAGRPYRHGWYMANVNCQYPMMHDSIVHIDLATGKRTVRTLAPGDAAGEPVFVPRSPGAPEGDGYIITLIYRAASDTSELLILDAQEIAGEPAAVLKLPRPVPGGAHGSFVPA